MSLAELVLLVPSVVEEIAGGRRTAMAAVMAMMRMPGAAVTGIVGAA